MTYVAGIDCGYSHLTVTVVDESDRVLGSRCVMDPPGDGHDREIALARLRKALGGLRKFVGEPVLLAGYCYQQSGVREAFAEAGWAVRGTFALNDVVGIYGLSEMSPDVLVGGCGSLSQVVYVDGQRSVRWPGADVERELPEWLLSGRAYTEFLREARVIGVQDAVDSGRLMNDLVAEEGVREFLRRAALSVRQTVQVFSKWLDHDRVPRVVLGGGAIAGSAVWDVIRSELMAVGVGAERVVGDPAAGLASFAVRFPGVDPWGFVGDERPGWLA